MGYFIIYKFQKMFKGYFIKYKFPQKCSRDTFSKCKFQKNVQEILN